MMSSPLTGDPMFVITLRTFPLRTAIAVSVVERTSAFFVVHAASVWLMRKLRNYRTKQGKWI